MTKPERSCKNETLKSKRLILFWLLLLFLANSELMALNTSRFVSFFYPKYSAFLKFSCVSRCSLAIENQGCSNAKINRKM